MDNFEAKHPRARDGKFTEKERKESGLTLELDSNCLDPGSPELPPQGILFDSGNPKPSMGVEGARREPEKPMVTSSERSVLRILWGMIKYLVQSLTFTVFAVILALALFIGVLFFLVEEDLNKNEPYVPEGAETAVVTIAASPSQTPAPAYEQV